jgi:hypothetical protein
VLDGWRWPVRGEPGVITADNYTLIRGDAHLVVDVRLVSGTVDYASGTFEKITTSSCDSPELSTWTMMLVGFAGLGLVSRRAARRRAAASP